MNLTEIKTINDNSLIVITSSPFDSPYFELKKVGRIAYLLKISKSVRDISYLFKENRKIERIIFDEWDSANIRDMIGTFADMKLKKFPNFIEQDFSNVVSMAGLFQNSIIEDYVSFQNDTLRNLENIMSIFEGCVCTNLYIDLEKTNIKYGKFAFSMVNCDTLTIKIKKQIII